MTGFYHLGHGLFYRAVTLAKLGFRHRSCPEQQKWTDAENAGPQLQLPLN
jgi:hypothetical protein